MRYVDARYRQYEKEHAYRIYMTDSMRIFGNLNIRYADLFKNVPEETRTADEIKDSIRNKLKALGGRTDGSINTGGKADS